MNYITVSGVVLTDDICPSQVIPNLEFIKTSKRSLGGKLHTDISDTKQTLQIVYDMLEKTSFEEVMKIFNKEKPDPDGLEVTYFDIPYRAWVSNPQALVGRNGNGNGNGNGASSRKFVVDDITFNPLIVEDGIKWKDVTISLVEV